MSVIYINETSSTSSYLKDLLEERPISEGSVVYTDFQTKGRGQQGNVWESEKGRNLLMSMILYPQMIPANEQFILSQIASLAVKDYLDQELTNISIKWPNDIYWNDKKICGILIENNLEGSTISQSVIGLGLNINQEAFASNAPNPISMKNITEKEYSAKEALSIIQHNILSYYELIKRKNTNIIIARYKESLYRKDGYHTYNNGKINFKAKIVDIAIDGRLVLQLENGEQRTFAFKEVSYIL